MLNVNVCGPSGGRTNHQALHFLETISPGALLTQLLSGLLGLSVFVLEEGCSGAGSLRGVQARTVESRDGIGFFVFLFCRQGLRVVMIGLVLSAFEFSRSCCFVCCGTLALDDGEVCLHTLGEICVPAADFVPLRVEAHARGARRAHRHTHVFSLALRAACCCLGCLQASVEAARRKVVEAVELLADASTSTSTSTSRKQVAESGTSSAGGVEGGADGAGTEGGSSTSSSTSSNGGGIGNDDRAFGPSEKSSSLSPFRAALLSADGACVAVKKAETALARAISLQRSFPGQVRREDDPRNQP